MSDDQPKRDQSTNPHEPGTEEHFAWWAIHRMRDDWTRLQHIRAKNGCDLPCEDPGTCACNAELEQLNG